MSSTETTQQEIGKYHRISYKENKKLQSTKRRMMEGTKNNEIKNTKIAQRQQQNIFTSTSSDNESDTQVKEIVTEESGSDTTGTDGRDSFEYLSDDTSQHEPEQQ